MPKIKTHSGAKKRFKLTKTGQVKRAHAYKSHILNKKTTKQSTTVLTLRITKRVNKISLSRSVYFLCSRTVLCRPLFVMTYGGVNYQRQRYSHQ